MSNVPNDLVQQQQELTSWMLDAFSENSSYETSLKERAELDIGGELECMSAEGASSTAK